MSALTIRLFGKLQIQHDDQVLEGPNTRKVQELLAYLLLYRERLHCRETLASLLWQKSTTAQSLKYLRHALWQLQIALSQLDGTETGNFFVVDTEWIGLNPEADFWFDVAVFEQTYACTREIPGRRLDSAQAQLLRQALTLYLGDLLEGWYQDWCLYERERLQILYLAMLDKMMGYCEAHQEYEAGIIYGIEVLKYDRARECTHRQLMRLHYLAGDRTAALRQYDCCVTTLAEELDVEPAKSTQTLYKQIRVDRFESLEPLLLEPAQPIMLRLSEVINHLKQFRAMLTATQDRIEQDIQIVERLLRE